MHAVKRDNAGGFNCRVCCNIANIMSSRQTNLLLSNKTTASTQLCSSLNHCRIFLLLPINLNFTICAVSTSLWLTMQVFSERMQFNQLFTHCIDLSLVNIWANKNEHNFVMRKYRICNIGRKFIYVFAMNETRTKKKSFCFCILFNQL